MKLSTCLLFFLICFYAVVIIGCSSSPGEISLSQSLQDVKRMNQQARCQYWLLNVSEGGYYIHTSSNLTTLESPILVQCNDTILYYFWKKGNDYGESVSPTVPPGFEGANITPITFFMKLKFNERINSEERLLRYLNKDNATNPRNSIVSQTDGKRRFFNKSMNKWVTLNCVDSDFGLDFYTKGGAKGTSLDSTPRSYAWDRCHHDGVTLIEGYCINYSYVDTYAYKCPVSCFDGICVNSTVKTG